MSSEEKKSNISLSVNDLSGNQLSNKPDQDDVQSDEIPHPAVATSTSVIPDGTHSLHGISTISENKNWFSQMEYIIFKSELKSVKKNNLVVLKECKEIMQL